MRRSAGGEEMKVFVPERRVDAPELSEEQARMLFDGRYVEGRFGLEEGDVFPLASECIPFEAVCYRMMGGGRCRVRRRMREGGTIKSGNAFETLLPSYDVTWPII